MKVLGVIPARYGSQRFPGKPLALIQGKPMIQWVAEGARSARRLSEVVVATDDERISHAAQRIGIRCIMTDSNLSSGTDRVWAAGREEGAEVLLNIQGDEPLITGEVLDKLVEPFFSDSELQMATLAKNFGSQEELDSLSTAKIVLNKNGEAIYFSRFPIPYSRNRLPAGACLKHIGIYAFRRKFLKEFCEQPPLPLELAEGLEQLRALYLGAKIKVVKVNHESFGVDTPEDLAKVEQFLKMRQR